MNCAGAKLFFGGERMKKRILAVFMMLCLVLTACGGTVSETKSTGCDEEFLTDMADGLSDRYDMVAGDQGTGADKKLPDKMRILIPS